MRSHVILAAIAVATLTASTASKAGDDDSFPHNPTPSIAEKIIADRYTDAKIGNSPFNPENDCQLVLSSMYPDQRLSTFGLRPTKIEDTLRPRPEPLKADEARQIGSLCLKASNNLAGKIINARFVMANEHIAALGTAQFDLVASKDGKCREVLGQAFPKLLQEKYNWNFGPTVPETMKKDLTDRCKLTVEARNDDVIAKAATRRIDLLINEPANRQGWITTKSFSTDRGYKLPLESEISYDQRDRAIKIFFDRVEGGVFRHRMEAIKTIFAEQDRTEKGSIAWTAEMASLCNSMKDEARIHSAAQKAVETHCTAIKNDRQQKRIALALSRSNLDVIKKNSHLLGVVQPNGQIDELNAENLVQLAAINGFQVTFSEERKFFGLAGTNYRIAIQNLQGKGFAIHGLMEPYIRPDSVKVMKVTKLEPIGQLVGPSEIVQCVSLTEDNINALAQGASLAVASQLILGVGLSQKDVDFGKEFIAAAAKCAAERAKIEGAAL